MNNTIKLTGLDAQQIPRYTYDEENQSLRVTVINPQSLFPNQLGYTPPVPQKTEGRAIEVKTEYIPVTQIQTIEVPVIVKELEVKTVEIPTVIIQKEVQIVEIERPITVIQYETIEVPILVKEKEIQIVTQDKLNYKLLFVLQTITLALIVLSKFLK